MAFDAEPFVNPMSISEVKLPSWPGGARVGVSVTFDLDADAATVGDARDAGRPPDHQLSRLSASSFGVRRGLSRVLDLLEQSEVRGTFYVPGLTMQLYPEAVQAIAAAGHEVALHGFWHQRMDRLSLAAQREDLMTGLAAHEACIGRPKGFRAPGWELTTRTLQLLSEFGLEYDSSLMGDDRPYRVGVQGAELLELPVHWTLDDWPFLGFNGESGQLADPRLPLGIWLAECDAAAHESRHVTYTMHPEVIGRGFCMGALGDLLAGLRERGAAFVTHGELAEMLHEDV